MLPLRREGCLQGGHARCGHEPSPVASRTPRKPGQWLLIRSASQVKNQSVRKLDSFAGFDDFFKVTLRDVTKSYLGRKPFTVQSGPAWESEKFSGRAGGVPGQSFGGHTALGEASGSPSGCTSSPEPPREQAKFSQNMFIKPLC